MRNLIFILVQNHDPRNETKKENEMGTLCVRKQWLDEQQQQQHERVMRQLMKQMPKWNEK